MDLDATGNGILPVARALNSGRRIGAVLTGGNVDAALFARVLAGA